MTVIARLFRNKSDLMSLDGCREGLRDWLDSVRDETADLLAFESLMINTTLENVNVIIKNAMIKEGNKHTHTLARK